MIVRKKLILKVAPHESAARLALSAVPEGWEFERMVRRGARATVWYVRESDIPQETPKRRGRR